MWNQIQRTYDSNRVIRHDYRLKYGICTLTSVRNPVTDHVAFIMTFDRYKRDRGRFNEQIRGELPIEVALVGVFRMMGGFDNKI